MRPTSTLLTLLTLGLPLCAQDAASKPQAKPEAPTFQLIGRVGELDQQPLPGVRLSVGLKSGRQGDGHHRRRRTLPHSAA